LDIHGCRGGSAGETDFVVSFEVIKQGAGGWIDAGFGTDTHEPFLFVLVIVGAGSLDAVGPSGDFLGSLGGAVGIEPCGDIVIRGAALKQLFDIRTGHAFESKEIVVERTIEMIAADISGDIGAALVECAGEDGIASGTDAWAGGSFFSEIFD